MNLLKLTLSISLLGIFILLTITTLTKPKTLQINQITKQDINKNIQITGELIQTKSPLENFQILTIKDSKGEINILTNKILNLKKSQQLTIIGKVQEYKNQLQIQADKITT